MANKRVNKKAAAKKAVENKPITTVAEEVKAETPVVEAAPAIEVKPEAPAVKATSTEKPKTTRTRKTPAKTVKETKMAATAAEIAEAPKQKATKKTADKAEDKFVIQSNGKDYSMEEIKEVCKAAYKNGTRKHVKSIDVYLKAENGNLRAYYVINGNADGAYIDL